MKQLFTLLLLTISFVCAQAQIDPSLLRRVPRDSSGQAMNMDAVYNRPFLQWGKLPVQLGGYMEANYQYFREDGISEGHQFQMRRMSLFISSAISKRLKFLTEIEFEDGAKEIGIEFASLDFEVTPLFNLRGGIILNPIGAFNQNHDGPKWEFVDRPISATRLLPATWSNAGFGVYGKKYSNNWVYVYEIYLSNGFDDQIINNTENRTFLPASKLNRDRFEESFNGSPLFTAKTAIKNSRIAELGLSYMTGIYNKFEEDGIALDKKRRLTVWAIDLNSTVAATGTGITGEWCFIKADVPSTYTEQYGSRQTGGFIDFVQPVVKKPLLGFEKSVINVALRLEYVDWNVGRFQSTGGKRYDNLFSVVPAISWRPQSQTVIRANYRYHWQQDILGNPPSRMGGFQLGISSYF